MAWLSEDACKSDLELQLLDGTTLRAHSQLLKLASPVINHALDADGELCSSHKVRAVP